MAVQTDGLKAKEIGKRIAQARKEVGGMTQRELGDLIQVTERSVAAYEAGDIVPFRKLRLLESALGKPAAWFLYGEESRPDILPKQNEEILKKLESIEKKLDKLLAA